MEKKKEKKMERPHMEGWRRGPRGERLGKIDCGRSRVDRDWMERTLVGDCA